MFVSDDQFEDIFGYSGAVRVGSSVYISGVTALKDGVIVYPRDIYKQTVYVLNKIKSTLESLGAKIEDVVRIRIYCTNIDEWRYIAKAHKELLGDIKPSATLVEVSRLMMDALVEIDVDALVLQDKHE